MSYTYHELKALRKRFFNREITRQELEEEVRRVMGRQMPLKLEGGEKDKIEIETTR